MICSCNKNFKLFAIVVVVYRIECYIIYSYKQRSFENAAHITTSYAQWSKHRKKITWSAYTILFWIMHLFFENLIHYVPQKSNRHDSAINSMPLKNRTTSYRNGLSRLGIFLRTSKEKANMARWFFVVTLLKLGLSEEIYCP